MRIGREVRRGGSDVLFCRSLYMTTVRNITKHGPSHLDHTETRRGTTGHTGREGYLDWYAGLMPLLYMLSVLATMLSKRCVTNKKHIPLIPFIPPKNASPMDTPYALLPMRVRGGV